MTRWAPMPATSWVFRMLSRRVRFKRHCLQPPALRWDAASALGGHSGAADSSNSGCRRRFSAVFLQRFERGLLPQGGALWISSMKEFGRRSLGWRWRRNSVRLSSECFVRTWLSNACHSLATAIKLLWGLVAPGSVEAGATTRVTLNG